MLRATSPRKSDSQTGLGSWFVTFSPVSGPTGFPAPFIFMSVLPGQCCFQRREASLPSPSPGMALASMTANPLHHLGLIRAQWQMISLHIKALKQLNKLAPSQSLAQELALNSEALPTGTGELVMKAWEPHAEVHRRSSVSQVKKWIPAVSNLNCVLASLSPWLSSSKPFLTAGYSSCVFNFQFFGDWFINPWVTQAFC